MKRMYAIILMSLLFANAAAQDISGEYIVISEKIYPLKNHSGNPGEITIDGEIIAFANGVEVARTKITDNEFHLRLGEVPPDILVHWGKNYDTDIIQCSDPETKIARLDLRITGTELNIERAIISSGDKEPLLRQYSLEEKKSSGRFSYVYSDRDAFLRGENHDEDLGQSTIIYNVSLKKGWNKIRHFKSEIKDFAGYYASISESTAEKGLFEMYYFDLDDYMDNDDTRQPTTLEGKIVVEKNINLQDELYFLLKEPIRVRDSYGIEMDVHKLTLLVDNRIHTTFPDNGNYILYGDIEYFISAEGDILFYVLEIKEKI
jgi:hypothetical protein